MTKEQLEQYLSPFITDLNGEVLSKFTCIRHHASLLLSLRKKGVSLTIIKEVSNLDIDIKLFSVKLSQAKRALNESRVMEKEFTNVADIIVTPENKEHHNETYNLEKNKEYTNQDWINAFGFNVNEKSLKFITEVFINNDITPDNWFKIKNKHDIFNDNKLSKFFSSLPSKKRGFK